MSQQPAITLGRELDPKVRRQLQEDDPKLLADIQSRKDRANKIRFPKPDPGDLRRTVDRLRNTKERQLEIVADVEELRWGRDMMDEKFARHLEGDPERTRIHSNLTGNEILRVVAMIDRNGLTVDSPVSGNSAAAEKSAEKRKRWGQEFFPAMDRKAGKKLGRIVLDSAVAYGDGAWELYRTDSYKNVEKQLQQGEGESNAAYLRRTDQVLQQCDAPHGLRALSAKKYFYETDEHGVLRVVVIEWKQYRQVYADTFEKHGQDKIEELRWPQPGDQGWASSLTTLGEGFVDVSTGEPLVETQRVYDRVWYSYCVAGKPVDGPMEHRFGRVPVFIVEGLTTSSDNDGERVQGITFGIRSLERGINDTLTNARDVDLTYKRPSPVVELEKGATPFLDPRTKVPARIDLSDPKRAPQLPPGGHIVNANAGMNTQFDLGMVTTWMNLFQRSGMNPVAQGASPGADPAGYTVATLISQVNDEYGVVLANYARVAGELLDCVTRDIRENIDEKVFLPVAGVGDSRGKVEWMGLGPDDCENVPYRVSIDPSSEQNRLARVQVLTGGWKDGVVPRRKLQIDGYGAEDPDEWDDMIIVDQVMQRLVPLLTDNAFREIMAAVSPEAFASMNPGAASPSGLVDQNGNPLQSAQGGAGGAGMPGDVDPLNPAPPQQPTVGGAVAAASQGGPEGAGGTGRVNGARAMAGQNRGRPNEQPTGAAAQ